MKDIPLKQLVIQAVEYLKRNNYSAHTINQHRTVWNSLVAYAKGKGVSAYTLDLGMNFIADHYGVGPSPKIPKFHVSVVRMIRMLHDIRQNGQAKKIYTCFSPVITRQHVQILKVYEQRQQERGLSNRTVARKTAVFNKLLLFLEGSGMTDLAQLKPSNVYAYLETLKYAESTRETILYGLRDIMRFLVTEGASEPKLAHIFPRISTHSKDPIPSVYSVDEITKILASVDRDSRVGKRDYAILLLAARLGMRAGDIHRLQISQIKWKQECIVFVQQKTNIPLVLPLLKDVKLALLDYLKNSRPTSDLPEVFLTTRAPYTNGSDREIYYRILNKYLKLANVAEKPVRKRGLHALRHSLASNLLAQHTPMPVITGILGHKQSDTTSQYLKVDLHQLRRLALEVPCEKR